MADIQGVEVFSAGTWNGDNYTVDDLEEIVRAYNETQARVKPSLKLGHDDNQTLLQKDGYPAAGWVTKLYRHGKKLIADFSDIPEKLATLIRAKAYRKVSSEIYWNINIEGKVYKRMLSAVALLGEDMPAVTSLDDMIALYGTGIKADRVGVFSKPEDAHTIKFNTLENSGEIQEAAMPKSEAEILKIEQENADLRKFKADADKVKADTDAEALKQKAALEKENADLKQFKLDAEKRAQEAEASAAEARVESSLTDLQASGLITPAMKPFVKELLGAEKKEYSVENKKLDRISLVKEILKLHSAAEAVNLTEQTRQEAERKDNAQKDTDLEKKVSKYAMDNKVTWGAAYRAVMKDEGQTGQEK